MALTEEEKRERKKKYMTEYHKKYYLANKEKIKARAKQWFKDNKEKDSARNKAYHKANRDKRNDKSRKWNKDNRVRVREYKNTRTRELCDSYVKRSFTKNSNLTAKDIPQSLIKAKRLELQMKRSIKDQRNG